MSDTQAMTKLRHELLSAMHVGFPQPMSRAQLNDAVRQPFLTRDREWLVDAVNEQLKVLDYAGLVRSAHGGFTLTERGRRDREQAARFFKDQPKDAA